MNENECESPSIDVRFCVPFVHRLRFTGDSFGADRHVLVELLEPSGPQPARVQFWLDANVADAHSTLLDKVRGFATEFAHRVILTGPPHIVAGGEGLKNDDVALADSIINVPLNPSFQSLNIAQAVFVVAYEWFLATIEAPPPAQIAVPKETRPANKEELIHLFEHLESELDACGFLHVKEKRPIMVRNLRNLLQRAELTEQEVRTLRGVIKGLVTGNRKE